MEGYDIRGTELKKAFEAAVVICGASCKAELSRMAGISESTIQSCVDRERIRKDTVQKLKRIGIMPEEYMKDSQITLEDLEGNKVQRSVVAKDGGFSAHLSAKTASKLRDYCERYNMRMTAVADQAVSDWIDEQSDKRAEKLAQEESIQDLEKALKLKRKGA